MTEQLITREAVTAPTFQRAEDGGLKVTTLMVPWHSPADVVGWDRDGTEFWYREQFEPGAFDRNADPRVVHRVRLVWGHSNDFGNQLGRAVEIRNDPAGAVGVFRVAKSLAERAREELAGQAVSVSFAPITPRMYAEVPHELVTRTAVHLVHVGVVDAPAYEGARVLEARADVERAVDELKAGEAKRAQEAGEREAAQAAVSARQAARATLAASIELARSWRALSAQEEAFLAEHAQSLADAAVSA